MRLTKTTTIGVRLGLASLLVLQNACGMPQEDEKDHEAPAAAKPGTEAKASGLALAGFHGFMITSDKDPSLALNAFGGATHLGPVRMFRGCTWENPDCTWVYRDGMILSDRDPTLALRVAGGTPGEGSGLELNRLCTDPSFSAPNAKCRWLYQKGVFLNEADVHFGLGFSDFNPVHGSAPVLVDNCSGGFSDACQFSLQSVMFRFKPNATLVVSSRANQAADQSLLTLDPGCTRNDSNCTFTFRKGLLLSDVNPLLAIKASGGVQQGSRIRLSAACVGDPFESSCSWGLRDGALYPGMGGLYFGMYPDSGVVEWSTLRLRGSLQCDPDPLNWVSRPAADCSIGMGVGGSQCGGHWQAPCPGSPCREGTLMGTTCRPIEHRELVCNIGNADTDTVTGKNWIGISNNGSWTFKGHAHDHGAFGMNYTLGFTLDRDIDGKKFGRTHNGIVHGVEPGSRDDDFTDNGRDQRLKDNWDYIKDSGFHCGLHWQTNGWLAALDVLILIGIAVPAGVMLLATGGGGCGDWKTTDDGIRWEGGCGEGN